MEIVKIEKFQFNGNDYEIRVLAIDGQFKVCAYLGDKQASHVHSVDEVTNFDFRQSQGKPAYDQLVEDVKTDIQNRYLEKHIEAIARP